MNQKRYTGTSKRNRAVIIFIAVFVLALLIFGLTLGIISAVKSSNAVYNYNGTVMDRRVAAFFTSRFKVDYFSALNSEGRSPTDSEEFWTSEYKDGVTYRENFSALLDEHLKEILVANYIFDSCRSLNSEDKATIKKTVDEVLEYKAGGDVERFNDIAGEFGFDYNSFSDAVIMYYKAANAFMALFGEDGVKISADDTVCGSYLNEYTHASLIVLREGTDLKTSEDAGERNVYLSETEKAERLEYIGTLQSALDAYKNGGDGKMTATSFENWLDDEENNARDWRAVGFYFNENAEMTAEFSELFPEVVKRAYEMDMYSFDKVVEKAKITMENGDEYEETFHVFIYKYPPVDGAYANKDESNYWFSDFYSDAAVFIYQRYLNEYRAGVTNGGYYDKFVGESIPLNNELVPRI